MDVYKNVFRHLEHGSSLGLTVTREPEVLVPLSLSYSPRQADFDDRDVRFLKRLAPHLERAADVHLELGELRARRRAYEGVLDELAQGIALVDRSGNIGFLNATARRLVEGRDGLLCRRGRLIAAKLNERTGFGDMIALAAGARSRAPVGEAMQLSRRAGKAPLSCLAIPIRGGGESLLKPGLSVLLLFRDPEERVETPIGALARLYGLSPRQAQLVTLVLEGENLPRAAEQLRISLNTAKTHLRRVFTKTGAANQRDLSRIIAAGPAGVVRS